MNTVYSIILKKPHTHFLSINLLRAGGLAFLLFFLIVSESMAQKKIDLTDLPLDELMNIEVITISRKRSRLLEMAAAAYVISQDDIHKSGYRTIPDLLRQAPGVQVAQIDANKWAISARGFNGVFANKLLVMLDGRSVYSPLFSGVFWEVQDYHLDDISRIEIIRGPGASLWGSNAVNGIINVVTKPAAQSQHGIIEIGSGTQEKMFANFRYGGKRGNALTYRLYGKYDKHGSLADSAGNEAADAWHVWRSGFRVDYTPSGSDIITFQGDVYNGSLSQQARLIPSLEHPVMTDTTCSADIYGANLISRWEHSLSPTSDFIFQMYYDNFQRNDVLMNGRIEMYDFDLQHRFHAGTTHEFIWGLGYRFMHDYAEDFFYISLHPNSRDVSIVSMFIQDEISMLGDRLRLTAGTKLERNDYTQWELQPNTRIAFYPNYKHTIWGAVSRAVRTPNRGENDFTAIRGVVNSFGNLPVFIAMEGNDDYKSEVLTAYEIGHRFMMKKSFSTDIALFYNNYDDLRTYDPGGNEILWTATPPHGFAYFNFGNGMRGQSFGGEYSLEFHPEWWWQIKANYSYVKIKIQIDETGEFSNLAKGTDSESPQNQVYLASSFNYFRNWNLNLNFRYIDVVPKLRVESYFELNGGFTWYFSDKLEATLVGQNLLQSFHQEYRPSYNDIIPTYPTRGVYAMLHWHIF